MYIFCMEYIENDDDSFVSLESCDTLYDEREFIKYLEYDRLHDSLYLSENNHINLMYIYLNNNVIFNCVKKSIHCNAPNTIYSNSLISHILHGKTLVSGKKIKLKHMLLYNNTTSRENIIKNDLNTYNIDIINSIRDIQLQNTIPVLQFDNYIYIFFDVIDPNKYLDDHFNQNNTKRNLIVRKIKNNVTRKIV